MGVFNTPETDVFSTTRNEFVHFYRGIFQTHNVEITDLFSENFRFPFDFDVFNVPNRY